jgi:hypothetical protein
MCAPCPQLPCVDVLAVAAGCAAVAAELVVVVARAALEPVVLATFAAAALVALDVVVAVPLAAAR